MGVSAPVGWVVVAAIGAILGWTACLLRCRSRMGRVASRLTHVEGRLVAVTQERDDGSTTLVQRDTALSALHRELDGKDASLATAREEVSETRRHLDEAKRAQYENRGTIDRLQTVISRLRGRVHVLSAGAARDTDRDHRTPHVFSTASNLGRDTGEVGETAARTAAAASSGSVTPEASAAAKNEEILRLCQRVGQLEPLEDLLPQRDEQIRALRAKLTRFEAHHRDTVAELDREIGRVKHRLEAHGAGAPSDGGGGRGGEAGERRDDLQLICGIGATMERLLNDLGYRTFEQIAQWTAEDVQRVAARMQAFPQRIERDDWIGQARDFHRRLYECAPDGMGSPSAAGEGPAGTPLLDHDLLSSRHEEHVTQRRVT